MERRFTLSSVLIVGVTVMLGGCVSAASPSRIASSIHERLSNAAGAAKGDQVWTNVQDLYTRRDEMPLWLSDGQAKARKAVTILQSAADHGLRPADYGVEEIESRLNRLRDERVDDRVGELAQLDVLITTAMLAFGHDVAVGRINPESLDKTWKAKRTAPNLVETLEHASATDLGGWVDTIRPKHREYAVLQSELHQLRTAVDNGAFVAAGKDSMSVEARIATIALNLERWRWLPDEFGSEYVLVNIPSYGLVAREHDRTALTMRVVVGKLENATPVFSGEMSTLVFSPYWNIPESIIEGEILATAAHDSDYLKRNHIDIRRITRSGAEDVDPSSIDWSDEEDVKGLAFRQQPGAQNALGLVKFLFPNPYDVYLHDTPADALFGREKRALSHGCVRLDKPEELATWVLRSQSTWDSGRIHDAMHAGVEEAVPLKAKIPVHIVYMTAWVDDTGAVQFSPDVYGHDAAQMKLSRSKLD